MQGATAKIVVLIKTQNGEESFQAWLKEYTYDENVEFIITPNTPLHSAFE